MIKLFWKSLFLKSFLVVTVLFFSCQKEEIIPSPNNTVITKTSKNAVPTAMVQKPCLSVEEVLSQMDPLWEKLYNEIPDNYNGKKIAFFYKSYVLKYHDLERFGRELVVMNKLNPTLDVMLTEYLDFKMYYPLLEQESVFTTMLEAYIEDLERFNNHGKNKPFLYYLKGILEKQLPLEEKKKVVKIAADYATYNTLVYFGDRNFPEHYLKTNSFVEKYHLENDTDILHFLYQHSEMEEKLTQKYLDQYEEVKAGYETPEEALDFLKGQLQLDALAFELNENNFIEEGYSPVTDYSDLLEDMDFDYPTYPGIGNYNPMDALNSIYGHLPANPKQKYNKIHKVGDKTLYKMNDGSVVIHSPKRLYLNQKDPVQKRFAEQNPQHGYWYTKSKGLKKWYNLILPSVSDTDEQLVKYFVDALGIINTNVAVFVMVCGETKIAIDGKNMDGETVGQLRRAFATGVTVAAGMVAVGVSLEAIEPGILTTVSATAVGAIKWLIGPTIKGGTTVLGHYPEYVKLAENVGGRKFQIPSNVWDKMSAAEQWIANTKFLDRMILRGDKIRLATPLNQVKPGSFFEKELKYLFEKGYKVSSDGLWLVK